MTIVSKPDLDREPCPIRMNQRYRKLVTSVLWATNYGDGAARIILPLYFASQGISAGKIGVMFFVYEAFALLTNMFCGVALNRLGYKRALVIALSLQTIASFGYLGLAINTTEVVLVILVNSIRALHGVGKELAEVCGSAYYKKIKPPKKSSIPIQTLLGGKEIARALGVVVGGLVLAYFGLWISFAMLGVVCAISLIIPCFYLQAFHDKRTVIFSQIFAVRKNLKLLAYSRACLYAGRDLTIGIALTLYLQGQGYGIKKVAFFMAGIYFIYGLSQIIFIRLIRAKKRSLTKKLIPNLRLRSVVLPATLVLCGFNIIGFILASNRWYLLSTLLLVAVLAGICATPFNHLHVKIARKKQASIDISFFKFVANSGKALAALLAGWLYQHKGFEACLLAATCLFAVSAFFSRRFLLHTEALRINKKMILEDSNTVPGPSYVDRAG